MDLENFLAKPNKTIKEHSNDLLFCAMLLNKYGYIKNQHVYKLLILACQYHDYGKANREFQSRIKNNTKFNEEKEIVHNILSIFFIDKNDFESEDDYYRVCHAVLHHHDYCEPFATLSNEEDKIQNLLSEFETFKLKSKNYNKMKKIINDEIAILIKGFLHKCDYAASAELPIEYQNDFLLNCLDSLNYKWNEMQQFCIENKNENILVVGQTGMGKTEAGLLWIGDNKGYFFLPLKSAINSMYLRIRDVILKNENINERLALLHSDSFSYYNQTKSSLEDDIMDHYNKSKQFSLPLTISTIDQLFDFVFKYQGFEYKIANLSYAKVVIDEIQAYDPALLAYLIYGLETLSKYGTKIAILTATLPPFIKDLLKLKIPFKENTFTNDLKRHNLKIIKSRLDCEYIYNHFKNKKGKTLVVCNSVREAQNTYLKLTEMGIVNVKLLHSKFTKNDRAKKEMLIMKDGKSECQRDIIWVTTQIVEASLDIDFDYLFTELSDLNGLFQRLGRCNRKGVKSISEPNCFIFTEIHSFLLNTVIDEQIYILSKDAIKNVDGVLSENDKIELINDYLTTEKIKGSKYYEKYREAYQKISELYTYSIDKSDVDMRNIESYNVIPISTYEEYQKEITDAMNEYINTKDKIEKVKLKDFINSFTISVRKSDFLSNKNSNRLLELSFGKYEKIQVIQCNYDSDVGFIKINNFSSQFL